MMIFNSLTVANDYNSVAQWPNGRGHQVFLRTNKNFGGVEEFTLVVASWVIRTRWREIRRFVLEFIARYFFLNSYTWCFLFKKSNLRVQRNNTLNLDCKEVRDLFLENLDFPVIFCNSTVSKLKKMYWKIEVF